jgi:thiol-disulfide isomerase/thioredoxin
LFYSDHCVSCPDARRFLQRLAGQHPDLVTVEYNVGDDAGHRLATHYGLIATPAFVIGRQDVVYGVPTIEVFAARLASVPALE